MARQWLESALAHSLLPTLTNLPDTPEGHQAADRLNRELRQGWSNRNLKTLAQQQGPMDQTRRAIKDALGEDHFSLNFIKFTSEEYVALNSEKQLSVADRNEQTQFLDDPEAIVAKAVRLLEWPEWADIAAGLAVLTGRRSAELLSTATFTPATQWSVTFAGALKRGGEAVQLSFEIPTLTTAKRVCNALERLRKVLDTEGMTPREINRQYEAPVARACDRHFADLVPRRPGRDNLYTHLFRAVYATIATFWYCPPSVNETEFKAAVQGHFAVLDEHNPELRRSLTASRHYADYEIADAVIARHGGKRKGVKLGHGGIVPIAMFAGAMMPVQPQQRHESASVRIWKDDRPTLDAVLGLLGLDGNHNQQERMSRLIRWAHTQLTDTNTRTIAPATDVSVPAAAAQAESPAIEAPQTVMPVAVPMSAVSAPSPLEAKIEALVETMQQFIAVQMTTTQSPPAPAPAKRSSGRPPKAPELLPAAAMPETPAPQESPRRYLPRGESADLAEKAIAAIQAHNDTLGISHDDKWAISINALKVLGVSQRQAVKTIEEHADDIQRHHEKHQMNGEKHNLRHRRKQAITDVIKL